MYVLLQIRKQGDMTKLSFKIIELSCIHKMLPWIFNA